MAGRILLNKAGKRNHGRKRDLRVCGEAPGQAVSLGLILIQSNESLWAASGGGQHVRASSKLNRMAINARPRVETKLDIKRRAHAAEIAERAHIEVEPGIPRKQR